MGEIDEPIRSKRVGAYNATRFNALKHGVLSQHTVLPGEDEDQYHKVLVGFVDEYKPAGPTEELLVEEIAGIVWRKRRLQLAEKAAYMRALDNAAHPEDIDGTARAALTHVRPDFDGIATAGAVSATEAQTAAEKASLQETRVSVAAALEILADGQPDPYNRALQRVSRDVLVEWHPVVRDLDAAPTAEKFDEFLRGTMSEIVETRGIALDNRALIRDQAIGEAVITQQLDRLDRHEVHLDRKFEKKLTMLMQLQEMRRTKEAEMSYIRQELDYFRDNPFCKKQDEEVR